MIRSYSANTQPIWKQRYPREAVKTYYLNSIIFHDKRYKTGLPASMTSPSLPPFCLHAPDFGSNKNIWLFSTTKNLFFKNSQHGGIVQNDTLTFCIKWILIEIKGLYFVFLNFTNSLNCEKLLQFCIKIEKFYIILYESNNFSGNLQNKVVFVKSMYLWFYCML